jgi:hypothetical protein
MDDEIEVKLCANLCPTDKNLSLKLKLYKFTNNIQFIYSNRDVYIAIVLCSS